MELKEISEKELKEKLELHRKWLNDEEGGVKLDLRNTNLKGADLSNSDLSNADLRHVDLRNANLTNADLESVYLIGTDLRNANLTNADLSLANLSYADLSYANLYEADLIYADLSYANLYEADLSKTEFYSTNLYKTKGNFVGVENIGSKNDTTHYFYNNNRIICGCFDGTMKEFEDKVKETYEENSKEYKQYMIAIDTFKKLAKLGGEE